MQWLDGRHSHGLRDIEISLPRSPEAEIILTLQFGVSAQARITSPTIVFEGQPTGQSFNSVSNFDI
jgi:hypothetical protein